VLWTELDAGGKWRNDLVKEMRAAGLDADSNKLDSCLGAAIFPSTGRRRILTAGGRRREAHESQGYADRLAPQCKLSLVAKLSPSVPQRGCRTRRSPEGC